MTDASKSPVGLIFPRITKMLKCSNYRELLLERAKLACGEFDEAALEFLESMYADDTETSQTDTDLHAAEETVRTNVPTQPCQMAAVEWKFHKDDSQSKVYEIKEAYLNLSLEPGLMNGFFGRVVWNMLDACHSRFDLFEEVVNSCQAGESTDIFMKNEENLGRSAGEVYFSFSSSTSEASAPFLSWSKERGGWEIPKKGKIASDGGGDYFELDNEPLRKPCSSVNSDITVGNIEQCILHNHSKVARSNFE